MQAKVGDRLCVHGRTVGRADHRMEIIEVRGPAGGPPYVVRYPDGHEAVVFPGPDAVVEPGTGSSGAAGEEPGGSRETGVGLGQGEPTSFEPEEGAGPGVGLGQGEPTSFEPEEDAGPGVER